MSAHDRTRLLAWMRDEQYAVEATRSADAWPQAAVVGVVVSERFEIFFDTLGTSRKAINLMQHQRAALVFGSTAAAATRTIQCEGIADQPAGADLERLLDLYFTRFPDGRERRQWPNITYFRIRPTWVRSSDYSATPPVIVDYTARDLAPGAP